MPVECEHNSKIIEQFSKQAIPFMKLPGHLNSIQMLIEMSNVNKADIVLDVACGPGLVACEFAKHAGHVTGIDLTEKMIEQAIKHQKKEGLDNLTWDIGNVNPLPYESEKFSLVVSRYSFHHFQNPEHVLKEMIRVCKTNGTILIADVALPVAKIDDYNRMEKLRDPSHVRALSYDDWIKLLKQANLQNLKHGNYKVEMELEEQLKASFPNPGDDIKIREIFQKDLDKNELGLGAYTKDKKIYFNYPISVYIGGK